jgi:hypothetical protein
MSCAACARVLAAAGSSHAILCTDTCFWFAELDRDKKEMRVSQMMQVGGPCSGKQ